MANGFHGEWVQRRIATDGPLRERAAALDLDDSTVAEHLQRAQRSILGDLLGD